MERPRWQKSHRLPAFLQPILMRSSSNPSYHFARLPCSQVGPCCRGGPAPSTHQHRAIARCFGGMEPAVRSTWAESATIAMLQKRRWCRRRGLASVRQKRDVSRRALSARNGILGCGDRAVEIAARDNARPQRQGGAETGSANPGTNGLSELDGKIPSSQGLGGGRTRARTWDPLIEGR